MTFVRWHYRDGVYVRTHHRRLRPRVGAGQISLLPTVIRQHRQREPTETHDPLPLVPVMGQEQLPLGA